MITIRYDELNEVFAALRGLAAARLKRDTAMRIAMNLKIAQKALREYADIAEEAHQKIVQELALKDADGNPLLYEANGNIIYNFGKNRAEAEERKRIIDSYLLTVNFISINYEDLPEMDNIPAYIAPLLDVIIPSVSFS